MELAFDKTIPVLWTAFGLLDRRKTNDFTSEINAETYDVVAREPITHDSYALVLMPNKRFIQNLPIGYHLSIACKDNSEKSRSYTPVPVVYVPTPCPVGGIPLLVKSYPTGDLSKQLTQLSPLPTSLSLSHPKGSFSLSKIRSHQHFALLAAGSGITPILSILHYLLERVSNKM